MGSGGSRFGAGVIARPHFITSSSLILISFSDETYSPTAGRPGVQRRHLTSLIDDNTNEVIEMPDRQQIQDEISKELDEGQSKVDDIKAKIEAYGSEASAEMSELLARAEANLEAGKAKFSELAAASDEKFDELWAESKDNWAKVSSEMKSGWASLSDKVKGLFS